MYIHTCNCTQITTSLLGLICFILSFILWSVCCNLQNYFFSLSQAFLEVWFLFVFELVVVSVCLDISSYSICWSLLFFLLISAILFAIQFHKLWDNKPIRTFTLNCLHSVWILVIKLDMYNNLALFIFSTILYSTLRFSSLSWYGLEATCRCLLR